MLFFSFIFLFCDHSVVLQMSGNWLETINKHIILGGGLNIKIQDTVKFLSLFESFSST